MSVQDLVAVVVVAVDIVIAAALVGRIRLQPHSDYSIAIASDRRFSHKNVPLQLQLWGGKYANYVCVCMYVFVCVINVAANLHAHTHSPSGRLS